MGMAVEGERECGDRQKQANVHVVPPWTIEKRNGLFSFLN